MLEDTSEPSRLRVAVAGASGYVGGELLRLLAHHPHLNVTQATSERLAGHPVISRHPNLRHLYDLRFCRLDDLQPADVLMLCLPHGEALQRMDDLHQLGHRVVDCSADFRLRDGDRHRRFYGDGRSTSTSERSTSTSERSTDWRGRFVYGLPELQRPALTSARYLSGVGCNATAVNLALAPLARAGYIHHVVADLKVGSSEGGAGASEASHHAERSGAMRSFAPVGHRHQAEIAEQLGLDEDAIHLSVTSVEAVRGVLATCHVFLNGGGGEGKLDDAGLDDKTLWKFYRNFYADEPFVRLVNGRRGLHRLPDPKILNGSNFCDVGWRLDRPLQSGPRRLVVLGAIDNLVKGAAGSALQSLNLACGFDETTGLTFPGLHPI